MSSSASASSLAGPGSSSAASSSSSGGASGGRAFLFHSDWGTELGTGDAARTDGDLWDILADRGAALNVVPSTGLGIPSANCLQVTALESAGGGGRVAKTGLGVPAAGQSFWYRWYYRNLVISTADNSTHPIESGQTGGLDWSFNVQVQTDTTWRPEVRPGGDQMDVNRARWTGPVLATGVTYRVELQILKLNDQEFNAHIRVYNDAGTLIADDDDFNNYSAGIAATQQMTLQDVPNLHFSSVGGTNLNELRAGNNGLSAAPGYGQLPFAIQGAFAVCTDDWCGPYANGQ